MKKSFTKLFSVLINELSFSKVVFLLSLIFFSSQLHGQTFTQYFDGADTLEYYSIFIELEADSSNIWQVGVPQKSTFDAAATMPNAIMTDTINTYPVNNVSRFSFSIPQDWAPWGVAAFQWTQKLDMDANLDGGLVEFSVDGGQTWENAFDNPNVYNFYGFETDNKDTLADGQIAFTGRDSIWRDIWLCFDNSWVFSQGELNLRFTFQSDSIDNNRDGWMIDNFLAHATIIHTVAEVEQENYIEIYPNPTTGKINIQTQKLNSYHVIEQIELINSAGKIVDTYGLSPTKYSIDVHDHPNGIYFLKIKTNIKTEVVKVLLQK